MLLCKCMDTKCPNKHWSDLSDEEQAEFERKWREDLASKQWPPTSMETK